MLCPAVALAKADLNGRAKRHEKITFHCVEVVNPTTKTDAIFIEFKVQTRG